MPSAEDGVWIYQANPNVQVGHRICIAWEGGDDPDCPTEDWYEGVITKVKDKGPCRHKVKYNEDGFEEWVGATTDFATSSKYNARRLRWHKDSFPKGIENRVPPQTKAPETPDRKKARASSPAGWSTKKSTPGKAGEEESSEKDKVFTFAHQKYAGKVEPKEQDTQAKEELPKACDSITDLLTVMEEKESNQTQEARNAAPESTPTVAEEQAASATQAKEKKNKEKLETPVGKKAQDDDTKSEPQRPQRASSAKPAPEKPAAKTEEKREKKEKKQTKAEGKSKEKAKKKKVAKEEEMDDNEFIVESIVEMKLQKAKPFFQVKWLGYAAAENTWEPYENVEYCEMLSAFFKTHPKDKETLDGVLAKKLGRGRKRKA